MKRTVLSSILAATLAVSGCESTKSSNPLSPTVAGPLPGVNITPPRLLEPGQGWTVETAKQPITLLIENASSNGPRPLFYEFDVAADSGFTNKVFTQTNVPQGPNGRTSLRLPQKLASGRTYYWRAKALDGANTGPYTAAVSFQVIVPVVIKAPAPTSPVGGATVDPGSPVFRMRSAPISGPVGRVSYRVEVALDSAFTQMLAVLTEFGQSGGSQAIRSSLGLPRSRTVYWRARAFDPKTQGPWSATQRFRTSAPAPSGGGTGGGGDASACGPPAPTQPLPILQCNRSRYGSNFTDSERLAFLKRSARDFNSRGISGGPFGILEKRSGNNCGGYSCDVLCAGQGSRQKQWDVLIDEEVPVWGSPLSTIRVDDCIIQ